MIDVTRLLCGKAKPADVLRYGRDSARLPSHLQRFSRDKRPVVVWNATRRCNLACLHCYADASTQADPDELTTQEARSMIQDLASFGAPVLLFSGGEPLLREDLFDLGHYAASLGIRAVISTNGTLIDHRAAQKIKEAQFSYVGISVDGLEQTHDRFRAHRGAFREALSGIRECRQAGIKVGLRFTICRYNYQEVAGILDLLEAEGISRCCFYHLVYTGRGKMLQDQDISPPQTRALVDLIFARTVGSCQSGLDQEILTVDNHTDGVYLYLREKREHPERAQEIWQLLSWNGGNSSGVGIGNIDHVGDVHPDQFWQHHSLGNIRQRPFSAIWQEASDPILRGLRNRRGLIKGKCSRCHFFEICNGNFRVRAEAAFQDIWAEDPACYLTEEEVQEQTDLPRA
jgi:radical SAM protein with 4Fe4S-binding SPASM domain